jgi:hypothetical protein
MENMDNQVQELEYILPDDYEEVEETTEADEESEVVEATEEVEEAEEVETVEEPKEVAESLDDLEVKYLHDVKKLKDIPKEELKTLVQKGMNHDRIVDKYNQASEKADKVEAIAKLYGMNETELVDALLTQYADSNGKTLSEVKSMVEQGKKDSTQKMYAKFLETYPDVKADSIPVEVWNEVKMGEDLTRAYDNHMKQSTILAKDSELNQLKSRLAELENKLKVKEQNETVKKKAVVKSTIGNGDTKQEDDDFLQGLFGK